jgi:hypothetical protein
MLQCSGNRQGLEKRYRYIHIAVAPIHPPVYFGRMPRSDGRLSSALRVGNYVYIQLHIGGVQARGGERINDPTHWPVFFALDDMTLLSLAGDVDATSWLHAPGAAAAGAQMAWQHAFPDDTAGLQRGRIGYGLLYTAGGAKEASAQAAYRALVATVHTLVLGQAARQNGAGALLAAFGGRYAPDDPDQGVDLDRLRPGIDPERLAGELDPGLLRGFEAFRAVAQALMPLAPGAPASSAPPAAAMQTAAAGLHPVAAVADVHLDFLHVLDALFKPDHRKRPSGLAPGTVVAATLQAWRIDEIPPDGPLLFTRPLPARGVLRASLRLNGRLERGA